MRVCLCSFLGVFPGSGWLGRWCGFTGNMFRRRWWRCWRLFRVGWSRLAGILGSVPGASGSIWIMRRNWLPSGKRWLMRWFGLGGCFRGRGMWGWLMVLLRRLVLLRRMMALAWGVPGRWGLVLRRGMARRMRWGLVVLRRAMGRGWGVPGWRMRRWPVLMRWWGILCRRIGGMDTGIMLGLRLIVGGSWGLLTGKLGGLCGLIIVC